MKALVLAGGLAQIELIKQLKERGITTVLIDGNANALAKPYADKFYQMAIFDIEAVKDLAVEEKVDFLITCCADQVLLVVARFLRCWDCLAILTIRPARMFLIKST